MKRSSTLESKPGVELATSGCDAATGDVILSARPDSWDGLFKLDATTDVPDDFMSQADRDQGTHERDPFYHERE